MVEICDKFLEVSIRSGRLFRGHETIEHEERHVLRFDLTPQQAHQSLQPFFFQGAKGAHVIELRRYRGFVEERHATQMLQHPCMRLGEKCHIDCLLATGHMTEADLVGENRLARAGSALNDVHATAQQAPTQYVIQPWDARRDLLEL